MLLLAEGLFRLDVVITGDTMRTIVRNLSSGELRLEPDQGSDSGVSLALGDAAEYAPGRVTLSFALGAGSDRVAVDVVIGTLRLAARGTLQVTAQGIVRHRPPEPRA